MVLPAVVLAAVISGIAGILKSSGFFIFLGIILLLIGIGATSVFTGIPIWLFVIAGIVLAYIFLKK